MKDFSVIPSMNELLQNSDINDLSKKISREKTKKVIDDYLKKIRTSIINEENNLSKLQIIEGIVTALKSNCITELKPVINGTGILLHTNLGRALFSKEVMNKTTEILTNYANVEFDLNTGKRGKRGEYVEQLICNLTNSEAAMIVNNNASAVYLILNELAKDKEVIVSRGELVEIGGSFRVPEIMSQSGAKLIEIGTTNKTRISDYVNNINDNTAMLMKVHQSNFYIGGFTEEATIDEIVPAAKEANVISYFDVGSGLIENPNVLSIKWDASIKELIALGTDVVSFSGDKLLGGTQAGIICGKKEFIDRLRKNQFYRVLRVGKLTYTVLYYTLLNYLNFKENYEKIPFFKMITQSESVLKERANKILSLLSTDISSYLSENKARTGGGSLPSESFNSWAIRIAEPEDKNVFAHLELMKSSKPIVSFLRDGYFMLDVVAIKDQDIAYIAREINRVYGK